MRLNRVIRQFKQVYEEHVTNGEIVIRYNELSAKERENIERRDKELHPSSFPFCPLRAAYERYHREAADDLQVSQNFGSDYFLPVGTAFHEAVQKWLGKSGQFIGLWSCECGNRINVPTTHPGKCKKCKSTYRWQYHEVGGRFGKFTSWHADGIFQLTDGSLYVVDYKGLALNTLLPTPKGWTTIGKVSVGDTLFDSQGKECKVVAKSDVHKRNCYKIVFDDNSTVVCDDEHLWSVTLRHKGRATCTQVLSTIALKDYIETEFNTATIELTKPLQLTEKPLPIDPYVLGCWLGDGTASKGLICKPDLELFDNIRKCGYTTKVQKASYTKEGILKTHIENIEGLYTQLRASNLLNNKHIPKKYLRSSYAQRLALVQGIFDTDGHANPLRKQAVLVTVDKKFAYQVKGLLCSLGQRATILPYIAKGFGKTVQAYYVQFRPVNNFNPFRLTRKAVVVDTVFKSGTDVTSTRRSIKQIIPVKSVETQCLQVDSKDRTFLCTRSMIPTHNTTSNYAIKKHRDEGTEFPYSYNRFQIETYIPLIEETYGLKIDGWLLVYCARDNPRMPWNIEAVGDQIDDERRLQLKEALLSADKNFGITLNVSKTPNKVFRIAHENKLCEDKEFYTEYVHSKYNACPLSKYCFKDTVKNAVFYTPNELAERATKRNTKE